MKVVGVWAAAVAIYLGFALFIARVLSYKWHPDKGEPFEHDPATCDECRFGDERNEWFR